MLFLRKLQSWSQQIDSLVKVSELSENKNAQCQHLAQQIILHRLQKTTKPEPEIGGKVPG